MPRILAFEAGGPQPSAAAMGDGGHVLAAGEPEAGGGGGAVEALVPLLVEVAGRAGWRLGDVEAFAVGIGPGGFTGLRAAVAAGRALALATGRPLLPVDYFEAVRGLARLFEGQPGPLAVVKDAGRGMVLLDLGGEVGGGRSPAERLTPAAATALLSGGPWRLAGDGMAALGQALRPRLAPSPALPAAVGVAAAAAAALAAGREPPPAASVLPRYARPPDAHPGAGAALVGGGAADGRP